MKKFLNFAVLGIIAGSLAVTSCTQEVKTSDFENLKTEVENLKNQLKASEVDLKTQLNTLQFVLQSYKDEVTPQLAQLTEDLKADYDILAAADVILAQQLEEAKNGLQAAIDENSKDIAANKKALQDAIAEYKKLVADAVKDFQAALEKAQKDQAAVDNAQDEALVILAAEIATYKAATDEAIENLGATIEEMAATLEGVEGSVEDLEAAMEELTEKVDANFAAAIAYTDALEASVNATIEALEERVAANEEAIKKLNEETIPEIEEAIEALQEAALDLEGNVEALEAKKLDKETFQAFLTVFNEWQGTVDNSITSINGSIKYLQMLYESMDGQIKSINTTLDVLNGNENIKGSVKQQIKALHEDVIEHLAELKEELEGKIDGLKEELDAVKEDIETIQTEITVIKGLIQASATEIGKLDTRITNNEDDIAALKTAKTELENKIKALEEALAEKEGELKKLISDLEADIAIINGEADKPGSIKYAVAQLSAAINTQLDILSGRIDKNEQDIAALQKEIGKLQERIQSLVFVPQYQDLKFGIPFTEVAGTYKAYNSDNGFPVVYKVAPAELAKPLAKAVNDAIAAGVAPVFSFDIETGLKTRAGDNDPKFIFIDASGDEETGKMTFHLKHMNFEPDPTSTVDPLAGYAISLRVDNDEYKVHVASEYVQAKLHKFGTITIKEDYIYKPNISTGEVDDASKIQTGVAQNLDIQYTDGATHTFVDGYELAAEDSDSHKIRTISQWKSLGYEMPDVKVTVTEEPVATRTDNIVATLNGTSSTFAVKIMDGLKDNMIKTKVDIGRKNNYKFAFNYGAASPVNVILDVNITKYDGAFQVKLPYTMTWTYRLDEDVDHDNINKPVDTWRAYTRSGEVDYKDLSAFLVKPYLTVGDKDFLVDGSNNVFGLEPSDFTEGAIFTPATGTTLPTNASFDIYRRFDGELSLKHYDVQGERLGKTYEYVGSYGLNSYSTKADITKVIINTVDRKTEDIKITAPEKVVKLLGGEYKSGDIYDISSASLTNALMTAYINQGIFDSKYPKQDAFDIEFNQTNISYIDHTGHSAKFDIVSNAGTAESGDETFVIKSNADFQSPVLHDVASNYGSEPWTLTVQTYVGQKVIITWPVKAEPLHPYRFVTYGLDSQNAIQVPMVWVSGTDNITKAQTEVDVIKYNNANVTVKYTEGTTETTVDYAKFADSDIRLVPRFSLVNVTDGIAIANSGTADLNCISNVTYYGQAASVAIKSSLFVKSGNIEFLVPGSDQMYVGGTPVSSITVKQVNPIADTQEPIGTITNLPSTGQGSVALTMKDILGNSLYADGAIKNKTNPYKEDVKAIFGSVKFSVYTVGGSSAITGWSIYGADSFGVSDTPSEVKLMTNGVATGSYDVVIRARTAWKDYYYSVKVNVIP
jgi:predicted  nucleic acid-binding Zn-ribbon protein